MVSLRHRLLVAGSLLLAGISLAHAGPTAPFESAVKDGEEFGADFCWQAGGDTYVMDAEGKGSRGGDAASQRTAIALPMEETEHLEHIWYKTAGGDLLLLFEASDGNIGRGALCRYQISPWTQRWCQWISAFNVVAALSEDGAIYVGGIGFLGKLDGASGKFLWQQQDLYKKDRAFNIFGVPTETADAVSFEATAGVGFVPDKRITLNRKSGEVLEIQELGIGAVGDSTGLPRIVGQCAR
ncbi:MAG: hypothetical protein AB7U81_11210 [Thiohalomonadaceae bacterium]